MDTVITHYCRAIRRLAASAHDKRGRPALLLSLCMLGCAVDGPMPLEEDEPQAQVAPPAPAAFPPIKPSLLCGQTASPDAPFMDVGHASYVNAIARHGDRILSLDPDRWILWNATTRRQVVSGTTRSGRAFLADLANTTAMTQSDTGFDLRRASDGQVLAQVGLGGTIGRMRGGLSSDGSFAFVATEMGLRAWDLTGRLLLERPGDYLQAVIYATATEILVANRGGAIETLTVASGNSTVAAKHEGAFYAWFLDGKHYLTTEGTTLYVYTSGTTLVGTYTLPKPLELWVTYKVAAGGDGSYVWFTSPGRVTVYGLGGTQPVDSFEGRPLYSGGRSKQQAFQVDPRTIRYLDLTRTPVRTEAKFQRALRDPQATTDEGGNRAVVDDQGVIFATSSSDPFQRELGCGRTAAIATSRARLAVATGNAEINVFDFSSGEGIRLFTRLNTGATKMAIGANGDLLVFRAPSYGGVAGDDRLDAVSLRSGSPIYAWQMRQTGTIESPRPVDFEVAAGAERVALSICQGAAAVSCFIQVDAVDGTQLYRTPTFSPLERKTPFGISPTGKRVAIVEQAARELPATTLIYEGDQQIGKISNATFVLWLDEERLIIHYATSSGGTRARVVDLRGNTLVELGANTAAFAHSASVVPDFYFHPFGRVYKTADVQQVWDIRNVYKRSGWRATGYGILENVVAYGADSYVLVDRFR